MDTKSSMVPAARSYSHKLLQTQGKEYSSAVLQQKEDGNQSNMTKSIKKQEKELKRIMQSQKSLANATKSVVKLMKVQD